MPSLSIGSTGAQVKKVQLALERSGLSTGGVDGKFGRQTAAAVAEFQRKAHLTVDGKVGPQTEAALKQRHADVFGATPTRGTIPSRGIPGYSAQQLRYVKTMAEQALAVGVPALLPVMTALVETGMRNLPNGDRDSVGLFQQRNAWGPFADRTNPTKATQMFLKGGRGGQPGAVDFLGSFGRLAPNARNLGRWAQAVQVSAYPARYQHQYGEAQKLLSAIGMA